MKISFMLVCTCAIFSIKKAHGSPIGSPFYPLSPEDLSDSEIKELEYWDKYYHRPKRTLVPPDPLSGSATVITHLKSAAFEGVKHNLGAIASGSASALAGTVAGASTGAKSTIVNVGKGIGGAALGSAGAIFKGSTGAVASASSGTKNVVLGSAQGISHLKSLLLTEAKNQIVGIITGVATGASAGIGGAAKGTLGAISGSANAIKQLGQIGSGSSQSAVGIGQASASTTSSQNTIEQLKSAALTELGKGILLVGSGSAKTVAGASSGIGQASSGLITGSTNTVNQIKSAAFSQISQKIGQIASGSGGASAGLATAASSNTAKSLKGAVSGSSDLIFQLKSALFSTLLNTFGQIASGSAKAATAASSGIKTKVGQISGDIAAGSADVISQLKQAVVAGTKKKIGEAASGVAGAITGAVGSASAGAGQLARGAFIGSSNLINQLKLAVISEAKKKIGQVASGSAGLVTSGSSSIGNGAKNALLGSANGIGQLGIGAAKELLSASSAKVGQVASFSAGVPGHIVKSSGSAIVGSAKAIYDLKSAAIIGTHETLKTLSRGSAEKIEELSAGLSKRSIDYEPMEQQLLDLPKRSDAWSTGSGSGSADIVNQLKSALVAGLTKKLGQIAQGSAGAIAGASAGFSKGSSGGDGKGYPPHGYEPSPSYDHKPLDLWELKKSVFNTLLQAVKAIKGGVLAINGQLIKGSGFLVAGGGKLLAASGDKVTDLGKNIIAKAVLVPPKKDYPHSDYGPSSGSYTAPSGPPVVYDAPSTSGHSYQSPYEGHYDHHNDKLPYGSQAGILILRRIQPTKDKYHTAHSHLEESKIPPFKPLGPTGPSFGTVVGKFFTASTSLDGTQPAPFDNSAHGVAYDSHGESHYSAGHSLGGLSPPGPPHYEEPRNKYEGPAPIYQAPLIKEHKLNLIPSNADFSTSFNNIGGNYQLPSPPATNYGVPYEGTQNILNINDHLSAEASNRNEQKVKLTKGEILDHLEAVPTLASSEILLPKDISKSRNALKDTLNNQQLLGPFSSEYISNIAENTNKKSNPEELHSKPSKQSYLQSALYPHNTEENLSSQDLSVENSVQYNPTYSRSKKVPSKSSFSQNLVSIDTSLKNFLPKESPEMSSSSKEDFNGFSSAENYQTFLENFPFHKVHPTSPSSSRYNSPNSKSLQKIRLRMQRDHRKPLNGPNYNVVKSVSYEITPDGATRLT